MVTVEQVKELRERTGAGMLDCKNALKEAAGNMEEAILVLRKKGIAKAEKKGDRVASEGIAQIFISGNLAYVAEINSETDFVAKNTTFLAFVDQVGKILLENKPNTIEEALMIKTEDGTLNETVLQGTALIGEKLTLRRIAKVEKTDTQVFGDYLHLGGKIATLTLLEGGDVESARNISMQVASMNPAAVSAENLDQAFIETEKALILEATLKEGKPANIAEKMVEGRLSKVLKEVVLEEQEYVKEPGMTVKAFAESKNAKVLSFIRFAVGEGIQKQENDFAAEVAAMAQN